MENLNFIIDSKDKIHLSKGTRIFYNLFGLFLLISSFIVLIKYIKTNDFNISFYSNLIIFLCGIIWIIAGSIGKDFLKTRKYILLTNDSVKFKKPFKVGLLLSKDSIQSIIINPNMIKLKTKDCTYDFNLEWIGYIELQQLKQKLTLFCNLNNIEFQQ